MFTLGPSERTEGAVARSLQERGACAAYAVMGYWFYRWDWGEAVAFEGLDAWAAATGQRSFSDFVTATLDSWRERTPGAPSRFGPALCLLDRIDADNSGRTLAFARRIGDALVAAPRRGAVVLLDAPSESIFVDSLASDPVFLLRLAAATGEQRYGTRAMDIALGHCRTLQDQQSGLFGHFTDVGRSIAPGIPWGRGNGWAALGLANCLAACPAGAPGRDEIAQRLELLCRGLERWRVPGAGWRNLIDREESYPESSTTVMAAAALTTAVRCGALDARWSEMADGAWRAVEHRLDVSGHLTSVSSRPGVNTDASRYEHAPALGGAYPWAQGPYLLAAAQQLSATSPRAPSEI